MLQRVGTVVIVGTVIRRYREPHTVTEEADFTALKHRPVISVVVQILYFCSKIV